MRERIGFREALSIGIGGMIGGGIFAVLGLSIQLSGGAAPLSFLVAGVVALTTAYSYARLSVRFPSRGGTIEFLVRGFGRGMLSGTLNLLLLASYIVMIALYAYAFGSYGANLLGSASQVAKHVLAAFVVVLFMLVNALGALISGRTEDALVAVKMSILLIVVAAGLGYVDAARLSPATWADPVSVLAGGMIIFLAYEGFELIANTARDVDSPSVLPLAYYASVLVVIALYVTVAVVTIGTLPFDAIVRARDYALAAAAKPALGELGFLLVTLAALVSTSSAINATLYGTARASYVVAKYGQLPEAVEKPIWRQAYEGLVVIGVLSIALASTASLESISTAGSGGFLLVFMFVNLAALRLRRFLRINPLVPALGALLCFTALMVLLYRMAVTAPLSLGVFAGMVAGAFVAELVYRRVWGREIEEYVDACLCRREQGVRRWEEWVHGVVECIEDIYRDAEVYLVGSVARGELSRAGDVDLLVLTSSPPSWLERRRLLREIRRRARLEPEHGVHL
ncbi:MAG: amino acid permease, partial [Euryarchaeota archaeon]|nr:amino acid permease [Euryarchaeota archaeon]